MKTHEIRELQDILPKYDYTAKLSRDRWAWEFYRRDPEFYELAQFYNNKEDISRKPGPMRQLTRLKLRCPQHEAEDRGLSFFPNPDQDALKANVFWSAYRHPTQLSVLIVPAAAGELDYLLMQALKHCEITHFTGSDGHEQFILRRPNCALQIRAEGMSLLSPEPYRMRVVIDGHVNIDEQVEILKTGQRIAEGRDETITTFSKHGLELRNALICLDAKEAGLSYWEMAEIVYGTDHVITLQNRGSRSLKDAMRRSLLKGENLRDGGFRDLLSHSASITSLAA